MLPNFGASVEHNPQRAPRPKTKFFIPVQQPLAKTSVTVVTTVAMRVFIPDSLTGTMGVVGQVNHRTVQNYNISSVVQTQHRFSYATI
jgi:hypothetical protein